MADGRMPFLHDQAEAFTAAGNAVPYCASGWSTPEPTETWTLGHESRLTLPTPGQANTRSVTTAPPSSCAS